MPTTLTATPQPGTGLTPPSVLLQVTGAPNPPTNAYASNFATVDGWAAGTGMTLGVNTAPNPDRLTLTGPASVSEAEATKALTGLTIGATYRVRMTDYGIRGKVRLLVRETASGTVKAATAQLTPSSSGSALSLDFVASDANMTVVVAIQVYPGVVINGVYQVAKQEITAVSVMPVGTWLGTTIRRTDANGTNVVVREDFGGQDVSGTTMTLTDYEAALYGAVSYTVTDGLGATASASTTLNEYRRNLCVNPSMRSTTGTVEVRRNYVPNPAAGTATTGWAPSYGTTGAGTFSRAATGGPSASVPTFVRSTWTTAPTGTNPFTAVGTATAGASEITATPGDVVMTSSYLRTSVTGQTWRAQVNFYTAAGVYISSFTGVTTAVNPNEWTRVSVGGTVPATAARCLVIVQQTGGTLFGVGSTLDMTGAMFEKGAPLLPYFDGATPAADGLTYSWTGTAHASASIVSGAKVTGWTSYAHTREPYKAPTVSTLSGFYAVAVGNAAGNAPRLTISPAPSGFSVGETVTLSARVRKDGVWPSGGNVFTALRWALTAGGESVVSSSTFTNEADGWMKVSVTSTVPAGANGNLTINLGFASLASNLGPDGALGVADVLLERSSVVGDFFDGSSANTGTVQHLWLGTADNSVSVQTMVGQTTTKPWFTLPGTAVPSSTPPQALSVDLVTRYDASSDSYGTLHRIIGRSDPLGNPGLLGSREGTLEVWCADYATAKSLRALLSSGEVALLRQPTHGGMDVYFIPTGININPAEPSSVQRWLVSIQYTEVVAP